MYVNESVGVCTYVSYEHVHGLKDLGECVRAGMWCGVDVCLYVWNNDLLFCLNMKHVSELALLCL